MRVKTTHFSSCETPSKATAKDVAETARLHVRGLQEAGAFVSDAVVDEVAGSDMAHANTQVTRALRKHGLLANVEVQEIAVGNFTCLALT